MKKFSFLVILLLACSLYCLPNLANAAEPSQAATIFDDMALIPADELAALESHIIAIKDTYDYTVNLVSAGYFADYDQYRDYIITFAANNQQGSGATIIFGLLEDDSIEWDLWGYGNYSDIINSQLLDTTMASIDYAVDYVDWYYFYQTVYADFLYNVEDLLIEQTGIWIQTTPLSYTGEGGMIDGFDPMIDAADLLTSAEEALLFSSIEYFKQTYDFDITFLTMNSVPNHKELLIYCNEYTLLDPKRDGVVFALNMDPDTRGYASSTRNLAEDAFSVAALDLIDEEIAPLLSGGEYYNAFAQYLQYTEEFIIAAKAGEPYSYPLTWQSVLLFMVAPSMVMAFLMAQGIVNGILVRKMKTAISKTEATGYVVEGTLNLTAKEDTYLNTTETKTYSPRSSGKGSSGGGRSGGSSRGYGGSRGGRSGRF